MTMQCPHQGEVGARRTDWREDKFPVKDITTRDANARRKRQKTHQRIITNHTNYVTVDSVDNVSSVDDVDTVMRQSEAISDNR